MEVEMNHRARPYDRRPGPGEHASDVDVQAERQEEGIEGEEAAEAAEELRREHRMREEAERVEDTIRHQEER